MSDEKVFGKLSNIESRLRYLDSRVQRIERMIQLTLKLGLSIGRIENDCRLPESEFRELEHLVLARLGTE